MQRHYADISARCTIKSIPITNEAKMIDVNAGFRFCREVNNQPNYGHVFMVTTANYGSSPLRAATLWED